MLIIRKSIAFFLLLLVAFPLTGFVWFHIQQQSIRAEMKKTFKQKELITVHVQQLIWYEKNKEVLINGALFDVSTVTKQPDGSYILKGLYDYQEQQLHRLLDKTTQENQKSPLLVLYASCFVSDQCGYILSLIQDAALTENIHGDYCKNLIPQFQPGILAPPPKGQPFYS